MLNDYEFIILGLIFPQVELIWLFLITDEKYDDDFDDEEEEKKDEEKGKTSLYLFFINLGLNYKPSLGIYLYLTQNSVFQSKH